MIILKLKGGLGNQMFQYACGIGLSIKYGQNIFFDISSYPDSYGRQFGLDNFNTNDSFVNKNIAKAISCLRKHESLSRLLHKYFFKNYLHYLNPAEVFDCRVTERQ